MILIKIVYITEQKQMNSKYLIFGKFVIEKFESEYGISSFNVVKSFFYTRSAEYLGFRNLNKKDRKRVKYSLSFIYD